MLKFKSHKIIFVMILILLVFSFITLISTGCNAKKLFSVSFYVDGEYVEMQETDSYVSYPKSITFHGNVLDGWYVDKNYFNKFNFSNQITENISLYARSLSYIEAIKHLIVLDGENVTSNEVGVNGSDGSAISMMGGTGINKATGYLLNFNNYIYVLENNRIDNYYNYVFIWNLESGIGSMTISNKKSYQTKFSTSFNLSYEIGIKSISDSIFYNTQNASDFVYQDGIVKTKKAIQSYIDNLDILLAQNYTI